MDQEYKASGVQLIKLENENYQLFSDGCNNINEYCEASLMQECIKEELCDVSDSCKTEKDPLALNDDESERKDNNMVNTIYIKGEPVFPQDTPIENEITENENEYECGDLEDIKHDIDIKCNIVDCPVVNNDVTSASVYEDGNHHSRIHNDGGNTSSISGIKVHKTSACNKCHKIFYNIAELKKQNITWVPNEIKQYKCNECNRMFSKVANAKRHINSVHKGMKNYKCNECHKTFTESGNLKLHINIVHKGIKKYICNECNKMFPRPAHLKGHINSVHKGIKNYKCTECDKMFTKSAHLKDHINSVHKGIKNYKCNECERMFSKATHLKDHINSVHRRIKNHKCTECNKMFSKLATLKRHINNVHIGTKKL